MKDDDDVDDDGVEGFFDCERSECVDVLIVNGLVTERWRIESNRWKEDFLFVVFVELSCVISVGDVSELDNVRGDEFIELGDLGDVERRCVGDKDSGDLPERSDIDFLIWFREDVRNVGLNKDVDESCLERKQIDEHERMKKNQHDGQSRVF